MNVAIDTETTGFRTPRIVQIALVSSCGRSFVATVDPEQPIDGRASRVHGITNQDVSGKPTWREVAPLVRNFISQCGTSVVLLAHNASFDRRVIQSECTRCNVSIYPRCASIRFVCTLKLARMRRVILEGLRHPFDPPLSLKLAYLYELATGKELDGAHDALADARACLAIYEYPGFLRPAKP